MMIDENELYGLHCDIGRLEVENAKLRELLSSYWKAVHCHVTPNVPRDYLAEMRKLGVEVNDEDVSREAGREHP